MVLQFLRKYSSFFFALTGGLTYMGLREAGLDFWVAFGIAFVAVVMLSLLIRRNPSGMKLD